MSSRLRQTQKRLGSHKRTRLNSRGEEPGRARTARGGVYTGEGKPYLVAVTTGHDLEKADKNCKACRGTGTLPTPYGLLKKDSKRAVWLACRCVPMKAEGKGAI